MCLLLGVQDKIVFDLDSNGIQCAEAVQLSDTNNIYIYYIYIYRAYVADPIHDKMTVVDIDNMNNLYIYIVITG